MIETERGAVVVRVDRARSNEVDQARYPRPEHAALEARPMDEPNDRRLRSVRREGAKRRGRHIVVTLQNRHPWRRSRSGGSGFGFQAPRAVKVRLTVATTIPVVAAA